MAIETRGRLNFSPGGEEVELQSLEGHREIRHTNSITYHVKDDMNIRALPLATSTQFNNSIQPYTTSTPEQLPPVQFNILGQMQMRKPLSPNSMKNSQSQMTMDHSNRRHSHSHSSTVVGRTSQSQTPENQNREEKSSLKKTILTTSDSPLDFSFAGTKKAKIERSLEDRDVESPCSRLRNMLILKSPDLPENLAMQGTVLNLSKESSPKQEVSPNSNLGWHSKSTSSASSSRSGSNSCSPVLSTQSGFVPSPQQTPPTASNIPVSISMFPGPQNLGNVTNGSGCGGIGLPMTFAPFGRFSPNLSPILSHTIPTSGGGLPLPFDSQAPFYSHHIVSGNGSPSMAFGNGLSIPPTSLSMAMNVNNSQGCGAAAAEKARGTRPFKAYPKDPMTFPGVGMYGMPFNGTPGTTETILHQQSNRAYADFRKQMLSRAGAKSRRGGQRNISLQTLSEVNSLSSEPLRFGLELIEPGAMSSGAEDSHSNCEEGYGSGNGKNGSSKSERQAKDEAYWERRRKNNEAAKRSRDARRAKEDEIAIRAVFLEQENMKLRLELSTLRNETAKLRCMLYNTT